MSQNQKQLAEIAVTKMDMIVEGAVLRAVAPILGSDRAPFAVICG